MWPQWVHETVANVSSPFMHAENENYSENFLNVNFGSGELIRSGLALILPGDVAAGGRRAISIPELDDES